MYGAGFRKNNPILLLSNGAVFEVKGGPRFPGEMDHGEDVGLIDLRTNVTTTLTVTEAIPYNTEVTIP
jgi:hypothetical protein